MPWNEHENGYFTGAMIVSYMLAVPLLAALAVLVWLATGWHEPGAIACARPSACRPRHSDRLPPRDLSSAQLREQITASTNKVEAYHRFAKWLFFGGEGLVLNRYATGSGKPRSAVASFRA